MTITTVRPLNTLAVTCLRHTGDHQRHYQVIQPDGARLINTEIGVKRATTTDWNDIELRTLRALMLLVSLGGPTKFVVTYKGSGPTVTETITIE